MQLDYCRAWLALGSRGTLGLDALAAGERSGEAAAALAGVRAAAAAADKYVKDESTDPVSCPLLDGRPYSLYLYAWFYAYTPALITTPFTTT
jgi:hypothetical protein